MLGIEEPRGMFFQRRVQRRRDLLSSEPESGFPSGFLAFPGDYSVQADELCMKVRIAWALWSFGEFDGWNDWKAPGQSRSRIRRDAQRLDHVRLARLGRS